MFRCFYNTILFSLHETSNLHFTPLHLSKASHCRSHRPPPPLPAETSPGVTFSAFPTAIAIWFLNGILDLLFRLSDFVEGQGLFLVEAIPRII